jgi:hypothetical protein
MWLSFFLFSFFVIILIGFFKKIYFFTKVIMKQSLVFFLIGRLKIPHQDSDVNGAYTLVLLCSGRPKNPSQRVKDSVVNQTNTTAVSTFG